MEISYKERHAELSKIRAYVTSAENEIHALEIVPRAAHKYPFDIVGLATLSKAFRLAEACLKLLAAGYPDEAHGLSRSLVECASNLRYLTSDVTKQDNRTRDFVKFALADKAFWYHYALGVVKTQKAKAELRAYARQTGIVDNPKPARQHWSGEGSGFVWTTTLRDHPLDGPVTLDQRKNAFAADYYLTSAFVHCSIKAIDNYFVDDGTTFQISNASGLHETYHSTLFIILTYIHHVIAYVLFGINVDRPVRLNSLFQRTMKRMKIMPSQHAQT